MLKPEMCALKKKTGIQDYNGEAHGNWGERVTGKQHSQVTSGAG